MAGKYTPAGIVHHGEAFIRDNQGNVIHVQYGPGEPSIHQLTLAEFKEMTKEEDE